MKCQRCGFDYEDGAFACPYCGFSLPQQPIFTSKIMNLLRDPLFAAFCFLFAVGAGATVLSSNGLPIFNILLAIFFYIVQSKAKRGIVDVSAMRCVSGTVYGTYVFFNVLVGIFVAVSALAAVSLGVASTSLELYNEMFGDSTFYVNGVPVQLTPQLAKAYGYVGIGAILFVAALLLVYNIFVVRRIHRFAKSVYKNTQDGTTPIVYENLTRVWMWINGVCCALATLTSLASLNIFVVASNGCNAAAFIIIAILIDRHFIKETATEPHVELGE